MSAGFVLAVIRALLQLWICSSSSSYSALTALCSVLLSCWFQQRLNLTFPSVSMRLRPERTCFGGFHIQRFFYLFLFLRGPLT